MEYAYETTRPPRLLEEVLALRERAAMTGLALRAALWTTPGPLKVVVCLDIAPVSTFTPACRGKMTPPCAVFREPNQPSIRFYLSLTHLEISEILAKEILLS